MARPVILFTGQWADLPLDELAARAAEWGYQGLELCTWGDHLEVQRALSEDDYCPQKLDSLARHDLQVPVIATHRTGSAVCDLIDSRHRDILPDYVWGDGDPTGVWQRAAEEVRSTVRVAARLGASVVSGFTGSPLWSAVTGWPRPKPEFIAEGFREFAHRWNPLLDAFAEAGVRFAFEVHPGQIAFDIPSAEQAIEALDGRPEFGFTFDPSHFLWQGVDPAEFLRRFADRIYHVHIKDAAITLNGRTSLLNNGLPPGDSRRGWEFRSPGHGGIDWESVIRALNSIGYEGPLSVEFSDAGMRREFGAADACQFVKRLDFDAPRASGGAFR
jgi:sugar phosphate isomerase/epimerase